MPYLSCFINQVDTKIGVLEDTILKIEIISLSRKYSGGPIAKLVDNNR